MVRDLLAQRVLWPKAGLFDDIAAAEFPFPSEIAVNFPRV
jgi:hypothetical protein